MSSVYATIDSFTTGPLRELFAGLGFYFPWQRALLLGLSAVLYLFVVKPFRSFDAQGNPRPWTLANGGRPEIATILPWWLEAAVVGTLAGLFI